MKIAVCEYENNDGLGHYAKVQACAFALAGHDVDLVTLAGAYHVTGVDCLLTHGSSFRRRRLPIVGHTFSIAWNELHTTLLSRAYDVVIGQLSYTGLAFGRRVVRMDHDPEPRPLRGKYLALAKGSHWLGYNVATGAWRAQHAPQWRQRGTRRISFPHPAGPQSWHDWELPSQLSEWSGTCNVLIVGRALERWRDVARSLSICEGERPWRLVVAARGEYPRYFEGVMVSGLGSAIPSDKFDAFVRYSDLVAVPHSTHFRSASGILASAAAHGTPVILGSSVNESLVYPEVLSLGRLGEVSGHVQLPRQRRSPGDIIESLRVWGSRTSALFSSL